MFEHTLKRLTKAKDKKAAQSFIQNWILDPLAPFADKPRKLNVDLGNWSTIDISDERPNFTDLACFDIGSLTSTDGSVDIAGAGKGKSAVTDEPSLKPFGARDFAFVFETPRHLRDLGIPFIFLTNSRGVHEWRGVEKLPEQLEIPLSIDEFVQPHTLFRNIVPKYRNNNVLVIGGVENTSREVAEHYGSESVITSADIIYVCPEFSPFNHLGPSYYASFTHPLPAPITPEDPLTLS